MSNLKNFNSMKARYNFDRMSNWGYLEQKQFSNTMGDKVNVRGKQNRIYSDPLVRIREDKLRSLKRALYNSYQSAVIVFDKDDRKEDDEGNKTGYHFRCLINHDKLKVDYEDKVLSIPFKEVPLEFEGNNQMSIADKMVDTGTPGTFLDEAGFPVLDQNGNEIQAYRVRPGATFKWISGNEGYMPDSYWIIFLQYSEETAYFRGQIRKADDEIEVIPIDQDGNEGDPLIYHGWTVGPNERQAIWNVKKGVVWNDLYYSKILYITKDDTTKTFFRRFNRVVINGQTWEVAGFNDNYGTTSKNDQGGMIRVALKETYTSTNEILKNYEDEKTQSQGQIMGPKVIQSFDTVYYKVPEGTGQWVVPAAAPIKVLNNTSTELKIQVLQVSESSTIELQYGDQTYEVTIRPFM